MSPKNTFSSFTTAIEFERGINTDKSFGLCFISSLMKMGKSRKSLFLRILHLLVMRTLEAHFGVFRLSGRHQVRTGSFYFLVGITH